MAAHRPIEVVIVGGGASGVLTAARMLDASLARAVRIRIVERSGEVGAGIAYGTDDPDHRLNVRAGGMSADPSRPDDFSRWSEAHGAGGPLDFAPRRAFRRYLVDHLEQRAVQAGDGAVDVVHDAVTEIRPGANRDEIVLASGRRLVADQIVLATGNAAPSLPRPLATLAGDPGLVSDPWAAGALDAVRDGHRVVMVGTGLTAVDVAITLARRQGVRIVATSRHGLLPAEHLPDRPALEVDLDLRALDPDDLTGLLALVRTASHDGAEHDWRDVVDTLRPHVNDLWRRASTQAQRRFLVRLGRLWDVHRHRMSTPTAEQIRCLLADGRLTIEAGHVVDARRDGGDLRLTTAAAGVVRELRGDVVVCCTGPGRSWEPPANPVVADLVDRGLARPDPHDLGLLTTADGRLVGRDGTAARGIRVIGPPRRGTLYETTAVPEIRSQALHIADAIVLSPEVLVAAAPAGDAGDGALVATTEG